MYGRWYQRRPSPGYRPYTTQLSGHHCTDLWVLTALWSPLHGFLGPHSSLVTTARTSGSHPSCIIALRASLSCVVCLYHAIFPSLFSWHVRVVPHTTRCVAILDSFENRHISPDIIFFTNVIGVLQDIFACYECHCSITKQNTNFKIVSLWYQKWRWFTIITT